MKQIATGLPAAHAQPFEKNKHQLDALNISVNETFNASTSSPLQVAAPDSNTVIPNVIIKALQGQQFEAYASIFRKILLQRYNYPIVIFTEEDLPVSVQQNIVTSMSVQVRFKRYNLPFPYF